MLRQGLLVSLILVVAVATSLAFAGLVPESFLVHVTGDIPAYVIKDGVPTAPLMFWRYWRVWLAGALIGLAVARSLRGRPETARRILFGLIISLSVVFGFISYYHAPFYAVRLVRLFGYWQILGIFVLFCFCLVRSIRGDLRHALVDWRSWVWPIALILGAAAFLHIHERHEFKIVMDEVVLQATAMRMHFEREADVVVRGYDLAGNFKALVVYLDKRPLFFPFLVSVLHDLTGYRVANAYILNGILTVVLTALSYLTGRRLAGRAGGVAAVLLLISIPLVTQNATGAGFELLNMVMILATLLLGMRFAERPEPMRLGAFIFSGVLLAQTRYESALFILPVGVVILYDWWRRRSVNLEWPVMIAPLLVVIIPLHFNVFRIATVSWQLDDIAGAQEPFGPQYFYDNVGHSLNFLFSMDGVQPNSVLVSILGILGVAFFMLVLYRSHREIFTQKPAQAVFCIFVVGLLAHSALMHLYFWGHFDDPVIRRLSLPLHLLFILTFVSIFPQLVPYRRRWGILSGVTLVYIVGVTTPLVAMHRYDAENFAARWNSWISDYFTQIGDESALAIDRHSGIQWFLHGKSSITVDALANNPERYEFHFRNHSFQHYYAVQILGSDFDKGTRFPTVDDDLGDGFTLQTVATVSMSPVYHMQLSEITAIDPEKIQAWRTRRQKAAQITPETKAAIDESNADALDRWFNMLP